MIMNRHFRTFIFIAAFGLQATTVQAGRPLVVDDANVNDQGKGHLEAWTTQADGVNMFSLSPAYAFVDGLEVGGLLSRETTSGLRVTAAQLKWRITRSQEQGCNFAAIVGASRATLAGVTANGSFLTGLATCNHGSAGSFHANLGLSKAKGGGSATSNWGIAYERAFGALTPHVEWFGSQGTKPTLQMGLRGQLADNLQLDGSIGRNDGLNLYTLGVKFTF